MKLVTDITLIIPEMADGGGAARSRHYCNEMVQPERYLQVSGASDGKWELNRGMLDSL